MLGLEG
jgi:Mrp family chromosome partitioning ATPase